LRFYIPYFAAAYAISFAAPERIRFVTVISLILFGYLFLNVFYIRYFRQSLRWNAVDET